MNTTVTTLALAALAAILSVGQANATESRYRAPDGYYRTNPPPSVIRSVKGTSTLSTKRNITSAFPSRYRLERLRGGARSN